LAVIERLPASFKCVGQEFAVLAPYGVESKISDDETEDGKEKKSGP
jgi:hypothetical protein